MRCGAAIGSSKVGEPTPSLDRVGCTAFGLKGSLGERMEIEMVRRVPRRVSERVSAQVSSFLTAISPAARRDEAAFLHDGTLAGSTLTNRTALRARLTPSVDEFARLFSIKALLSPSTPNPPPGGPAFPTLLTIGIDAMTARFVDWLAKRL